MSLRRQSVIRYLIIAFYVITVLGLTVRLLSYKLKPIAGKAKWEKYKEVWYEKCGRFPNQKRAYETWTAEPNVKTAKCSNLLQNLTDGFWRLRRKYDRKEAEKLENIQKTFRSKHDIPKVLWRKDGKCGYAEHLPHSNLGSICNPNGVKTCCSDVRSGVCVDANFKGCDCERCQDSAKFVHPELADWITHDPRCKWVNYTAEEGCAVLNKLASNMTRARLFFVGDSLVHHMFLGLMIHLTGNKETGTWRRCLTDDVKKTCRGQNQMMWMRCLGVAAGEDLDDVDDGSMCKERHFDASFHGYFSSYMVDETLELTKTLLNKQNTYIIMGIGLHDKCDSSVVLANFIRPIVEFIELNKSDWPRLMWVHPLSIGPASPGHYWDAQQGERIKYFVKDIDQYLKSHDIPSFNFYELTRYAHSHDGTHYGIAVNLMKVQIWLNYMASQL